MSRQEQQVIAIIPARSGSKGVPDKNVAPVAGHPLLAWSIEAALRSVEVDRVLVSTDSEQYAALARRYGADVPFLRPAELASDTSVDRDFMLHAMEWLAKREGRKPPFWVLLRPTTPLRNPALIDDAVRSLRASPTASGLRSAHPCPESPFKWFRINRAGHYTGLLTDSTAVDAFNGPRQAYETVYIPNGYVDVVRRATVTTSPGLFGDPVLAYLTPTTPEVDTPEELALIRQMAHDHPLRPELDRRP